METMYTNGTNTATLESIRNIYNTALERNAVFWLMRRELPSLDCNNSVSDSNVDIYLVGTKGFALLSRQIELPVLHIASQKVPIDHR